VFSDWRISFMLQKFTEVFSAVEAARFRDDRDSALALCRSAVEREIDPIRFALIAARIEMGAGWIHRAADWIETARARAVTAEARLSVDLDNAMCSILSRLDLAGALAAARQADGYALAPLQCLARSRILLAAGIYREISEADRRETWKSLRPLQRKLAASGEVYQAHGVAIDRRDRTAARYRPRACAALRSLGASDGQPATVAEGHLGEAVALREGRADDAKIEAALDHAAAAYAAAGHQTGALHVERERAHMMVDRYGAPPFMLVERAEVYLAAGRPKAAAHCLMNARMAAQRLGDRRMSLDITARIARLAEEVGLGLLREDDALNFAERAMRDGWHSDARDICDEALARPLPRMMTALFLVLRGSAQSFAHARNGAITDRQRAVGIFEEVGAEDSASDVIPALASDIARTRLDADLDVADALLVRWIERDRARGVLSAAYDKWLQRMQIPLLRFLARKADGRSDLETAALLYRAEALIAEAEIVAELSLGSHPDRGRMIAGRAQMQAQIATAREDFAGALAAQEQAVAEYQALKMPFEEANCHYLIGCLMLNGANAPRDDEDFVARATRSHAELTAALSYYEGTAGMRHEAAMTRHKLAMLYLNVQHRMQRETADAMCAEARENLRKASGELDDLRRAYTSPGHLESFESKSRLNEAAVQVDQEGLRLSLILRPDPAEAWLWTARSKARAFNDLLGARAIVPLEVAKAAQSDASLRALVAEEATLSQALADAPAAERLSLGRRLQTVQEEMRRRPVLSGYIELRLGDQVDADDLAQLGAAAPEPVCLVDWIAVRTGLDSRLYLCVARPGEVPVVEPLPLPLSRVAKLAGMHLGPRTFRMTLWGDPSALDDFAPLIAPLEWLTRPNETLLLCPTGILHAVPFHALTLAGRSLWERNRLAFTPSLGVLRSVCQPRPASRASARVFGDPSEDRPDARTAGIRVARSLDTEPVLGAEATRIAFEAALSEADIIHFQGHAEYDGGDPLSSCLRLADGPLAARDLFDRPQIACAMLTLGACQSGMMKIETGDEPFGLIAALLLAGLRSVTAATWQVHDGSAAALMEAFYAGLRSGGRPIDALRAAAFDVRDRLGFTQPYHWAPFRIFGNPWHRPFPQEKTE
jgi:hypothetical protein